MTLYKYVYYYYYCCSSYERTAVCRHRYLLSLVSAIQPFVYVQLDITIYSLKYRLKILSRLTVNNYMTTVYISVQLPLPLPH